MKAVTVISICTAILVLSGCGAVSDADEKIFVNHRQPDELERQFLYLARYLDSAKPCFLIHPKSLSIGPFSPAGTKVSFIRSICFRDVAFHTGDNTPCQHVRSVSTFLYSGDKLNAAFCRETATGHGRLSNNLNIREIVALAGYSESDIDTFLVAEGRFSSAERAAYYRDNEPSVFWLEVMEYVIGSREFFDRIETLPGFASERDIEAMKNVTWRPRFQKELPPPEESLPNLPEFRIKIESAMLQDLTQLPLDQDLV